MFIDLKRLLVYARLRLKRDLLRSLFWFRYRSWNLSGTSSPTPSKPGPENKVSLILYYLYPMRFNDSNTVKQFDGVYWLYGLIGNPFNPPIYLSCLNVNDLFSYYCSEECTYPKDESNKWTNIRLRTYIRMIFTNTKELLKMNQFLKLSTCKWLIKVDDGQVLECEDIVMDKSSNRSRNHYINFWKRTTVQGRPSTYEVE